MVSSLGMILFLIVLLHFMAVHSGDLRSTRISAAKIAAEKGYNVYLNGESVDIDTVDLTRYHITIDDEKEVILLTRE